jgi:hypothetical protein
VVLNCCGGCLHFISTSSGELHRQPASEMRAYRFVFLGVLAIGLMSFYHVIPLIIVRAGWEPLPQWRPFVLTGSVLTVAFGLYQSWRQMKSGGPVSSPTISVLCIQQPWCSA